MTTRPAVSESAPPRRRRRSETADAPTAERAGIVISPLAQDWVKVLLPWIAAFAAFLIVLWSQQRQSETMQAQVAAKVAVFEQAKEDRGARLSVVESKVDSLTDDVKEIRGDVKTLLQRK